jgi:hypothetical protein
MPSAGISRAQKALECLECFKLAPSENCDFETAAFCWRPKCIVGCDSMFAVSTANLVDFAVEKAICCGRSKCLLF